MIRLYGIEKEYKRGQKALKGLDLQVGPGEFCFLTGPSGAGKTTLLKLIIREEKPTAGQILVLGRNLATLRETELPHLRRRLGVVFQDFKLIYGRTVLDNVAYVLKMLGVMKEERIERAFEALSAVGLSHRLDAYPQELSGGEQQRVAVARALTNNPDLLLADEPTGNLDPERSFEIMRLFKEASQGGTTVMVATHDPSLIEAFGGRILLLDDGLIVDDGR